MTNSVNYPKHRESGIIIKFDNGDVCPYSWCEDTIKQRKYLYKSGYLYGAEYIQFIGREDKYTQKQYIELMKELYDNVGEW